MDKWSLKISPVDAWFFRDSRPYNKGESHQTHVRSLFPPLAPTAVGAMRANLAYSAGWDGRSSWDDQDEEFRETLGSGYENLGNLDFKGPHVIRRSSKRSQDTAYERLYPMPLHVLGRVEPAKSGDRWVPKTLLEPGAPTLCDLGEVRLPQPRVDEFEGLKEPSNLWITQQGMIQILSGGLPDAAHIMEAGKLWSHEWRVGLHRHPTKLITEENALYSPGYVRPESDVAIGLEIGGIPEGDRWSVSGRVPFGGERRMANIDHIELPDPPQPTSSNTVRGLTVTFITPGRFSGDALEEAFRAGGALDQSFGVLADYDLASACVGKRVYIGGWNSIERKPLPLKPYIPAGTTLFFSVSPSDHQKVLELHGEKIGERTSYGFGQVLIGYF